MFRAAVSFSSIQIESNRSQQRRGARPAALAHARGIPCWIAPRDVKPGAQYADAIVRAIGEAKAVVLIMSASAMVSSHVRREVERAASKYKPIIAFRLDAAALNPALEYFLSESQWIDVPALGMPAALSKLAEAVAGPRLLDPQTGAEHQLTDLPSNIAIGDFDVSPDGTEIIFDRAQDSSNIALFDRTR